VFFLFPQGSPPGALALAAETQIIIFSWETPGDWARHATRRLSLASPQRAAAMLFSAAGLFPPSAQFSTAGLFPSTRQTPTTGPHPSAGLSADAGTGRSPPAGCSESRPFPSMGPIPVSGQFSYGAALVVATAAPLTVAEPGTATMAARSSRDISREIDARHIGAGGSGLHSGTSILTAGVHGGGSGLTAEIAQIDLRGRIGGAGGGE